MKPYSTDEVFEILDGVNCKQDLVELTNYLVNNLEHYSLVDRFLFLQAMHIYHEIFY
jgi:hypothetical protein